MSDKISVFARIRPMLTREKVENRPTFVKSTEKTITCDGEIFNFDQVFDQTATNQTIYDHVAKNVVLSAMEGYNATLFMYGQTASGKTYTVNHIRQEALTTIYDFIENSPDREFLLRISYLELYNERFEDLLSSDGESKSLMLREDLEKNVFLTNQTEIFVTSIQDVANVLKRGDEKRHVAETKANDCSSRSHCILRVIIESRLRDDPDLESSGVFVSNLTIVDLAGSEKASDNTNSYRFKEGCNINKSLLTLSQVIRKLSEASDNENCFINYRDSKLTRYLQNALGGNSKTAIILTISPTSLEETVSTLKFGQNAKKIKNIPKKNEILNEQAELKRSLKEIERLKECIKKLESTQSSDELEEQKKKQKVLTEELRSMLCISSKASDKKEKNRRQTVCVPQFSRFKAATDVYISPVKLSPPASRMPSSQQGSPEIEDLNLSFKEYEKIFIQEDSFKKLYDVIFKLQQENQSLQERLNFMNHLENTEAPSLVSNESLLDYDGPVVNFTMPLDESLMDGNPRRKSFVHWQNVTLRDHSCSKPPAVDCISEGEEEEEVSTESTATENQSLDLETKMVSEEGKLDQKMKEYIQLKDSVESKIEQLCYLEQLRDEIEELKDEAQKEREKVVDERNKFEDEKKQWLEQKEAETARFSDKNVMIENHKTDLYFRTEKRDIDIQTDMNTANVFDEIREGKYLSPEETLRIEELKEELIAKELHLSELKYAMDKLESAISQERKSMEQMKQEFANKEKCVQQKTDQLKLEEELLKDKLDELISKEKLLSRQKDSEIELEKKLLESQVCELEEKLLVLSPETCLMFEQEIQTDLFLEELSQLQKEKHLLQLEKEKVEEMKNELATQQFLYRMNQESQQEEEICHRKENMLEERIIELEEKLLAANKERGEMLDMEAQTTELSNSFFEEIEEIKRHKLIRLVENEDLEKRIEDLKNQENELKIKEENLEKLAHHVEATREELAEKESQLVQKQSLLDRLKVDLESQMSNMTEREKDLVEQENVFKFKEDDLEAKRKDIAEKELILCQEQNHIDRLKVDLECQISNMTEREKDLVEQENVFKFKEDDLEAKRKEIAEKELILCQKQNHIDRLKVDLECQISNMTEREKDLVEQENVFKCKEDDLEAKRKEIAEKEFILCEEQSHLDRLKIDLECHISDLTDRENLIQQEADQLKLQKEELTLKAKFLEDESQLKNKEDMIHSEQIEQLNALLEEAQNAQNFLTTALEERSQELEEAIEEIEHFQQKIEWGKGVLNEKNLKIKEAEETHQKLQAQLTKMEEDMDTMKASIANHESQLAAKEEELRRGKMTIQNIEKDMQALQSMLKHTEEKNKELQMENSSLNKKVKNLKESNELDRNYYQRAIDNLKRSHNFNVDGSFLEQKAPEVPEIQVKKKLELEFSLQMKEFERSISGKDKKIDELMEEITKVKEELHLARSSSVLKDRNLQRSENILETKKESEVSKLQDRILSLERKLEEADMKNLMMHKKYQQLKVKFAESYKLGAAEAFQEFQSTVPMQGGAVESFKLVSLERENRHLQKKLARLEEELRKETKLARNE
ncbi:centromere-associated protein E-like isoform X2 [Biomphalaria glabrata]|uniref:Centromere-associated protein E-like isoform X2 n=1 Tax=Biomphalaria glabrata TaxID=6526 RepID=A0A9W3B261_BIOGL|nr:centromere-associated protein E-like isoform X2 [Biomphalaria glabrata]